MYDEEGYLQDEYDMRRDELGLGKAPKPVFTGFGAPDDSEDEYDNGYDSELLEDYDPDDFDDTYDDSETDTPEGTQSTGSGTSGGDSGGRVISRRSTTGTGSNDADKIKVTLDANKGTIEGKKSITVELEKGEDYDELPTPDERKGYKFTGWYTKKKGGTQADSKVLNSKGQHTLYAHWEKANATPEPEPQPETKTYTVVYKDGAGGAVFSDKSTGGLKQGDATPSFGDNPVRDGYSFLGWDPEVAATVDAANADSGNTITYTAKWDDLYTVWSDTFSQTTTDLEEKDYTINVDDGDCKSLVESCKGKIVEDSKNIIVFTDDMDDIQHYKDDYDEADSVIVVSKKATKDTDEANKNRRLYLKLLLLSDMHNLDIKNAKTELGITDDDDTLVVVIK